MINLILGDCLNKMRGLPEASVDMVCADIPYGTTQCKWDSVIDLAEMWKEIYRVTKPEAAVVLFSAQPFTSVLVASNLSHWRTEWIWEKTQATGFLNAKKQPLRAHENIEVFYRRQPTYNPQLTHGHVRKTAKRGAVDSDCYNLAIKETAYDSTSRYPRTVQVFSKDTQRQSYHPTQKPVALVRYLIETYSNPGDHILDFTMGSGSAGEACVLSDRSFTGIENDRDIFQVAQDRIGSAQLLQENEEL